MQCHVLPLCISTSEDETGAMICSFRSTLMEVDVLLCVLLVVLFVLAIIWSSLRGRIFQFVSSPREVIFDVAWTCNSIRQQCCMLVFALVSFSIFFWIISSVDSAIFIAVLFFINSFVYFGSKTWHIRKAICHLIGEKTPGQAQILPDSINDYMESSTEMPHDLIWQTRDSDEIADLADGKFGSRQRQKWPDVIEEWTAGPFPEIHLSSATKARDMLPNEGDCESERAADE